MREDPPARRTPDLGRRRPPGRGRQAGGNKLRGVPEEDRTRAPRAVLAAAALVAAEGVALLALAVVELVSIVVSDELSVGLALVTAAFAAGGGLLVLWLSRLLRALRPPARSPVTAIQLVMLPIGWNLLSTNGRPELGIPVLALAVAVLALLFGTAEARAALARPPIE